MFCYNYLLVCMAFQANDGLYLILTAGMGGDHIHTVIRLSLYWVVSMKEECSICEDRVNILCHHQVILAAPTITILDSVLPSHLLSVWVENSSGRDPWLLAWEAGGGIW